MKYIFLLLEKILLYGPLILSSNVNVLTIAIALGGGTDGGHWGTVPP